MAPIGCPTPSLRVGRFSSGFPPKLLRRLRYGEILIITKTPRDNPVDCLHPRRHCLGMELTAKRTPPTLNNLPASLFRDWRLPLLPHPSNGDRHSKPATLLMSSQFSEDFPGMEGEKQEGKTRRPIIARDRAKSLKFWKQRTCHHYLDTTLKTLA